MRVNDVLLHLICICQKPKYLKNEIKYWETENALFLIFKWSILFKLYRHFLVLQNTYNVDDSRTWKRVCVECNAAQSLMNLLPPCCYLTMVYRPYHASIVYCLYCWNMVIFLFVLGKEHNLYIVSRWNSVAKLVVMLVMLSMTKNFLKMYVFVRFYLFNLI